MKIRTITVNAGRTFNHPHEQYSNLRPEVTYTADLDEGEDPVLATKQLQQMAETSVEDHKRAMLKSLDELYYSEQAQKELQQLGTAIARNQARVDELRNSYPHLIDGGQHSDAADSMPYRGH